MLTLSLRPSAGACDAKMPALTRTSVDTGCICNGVTGEFMPHIMSGRVVNSYALVVRIKSKPRLGDVSRLARAMDPRRQPGEPPPNVAHLVPRSALYSVRH